MPARSTILRILIHLLLAAFLANAANKFFVGDLEYEAEHQFYARIFDSQGDAPDQYRILPLLPLKALTSRLSFNYSVLIYNIFFGFLALELFSFLMRGWSESRKYSFVALFSILYIYCQYTGWRPDTMGLMVAVAGTLALAEGMKTGPIRHLALLGGIALISFCRADIALAYAVIFAFYYTENWIWRGAMVLVPIAAQLLLQSVLFPDAEYYSEKFMLWDNLRLYYLLRHPATYLILAVLIAWRKPIFTFLRSSLKKYWGAYIIFGGYLLLVLFIGRLNEYRLYLPFVPFFLVMARDLQLLSEHEKGTGAV